MGRTQGEGVGHSTTGEGASALTRFVESRLESRGVQAWAFKPGWQWGSLWVDKCMHGGVHGWGRWDRQRWQGA